MKDVTSRLGIDAALGLANSLHGPGAHYRRRAHAGDPPHDHLTTPTDAIEFLSSHAVPVPVTPPTEGDLARLRAIRALVRALATRPDGDLSDWRAAVDEALGAATYRLGADGSLRSPSAGWDGIGDDLLPAALALARERGRIRTCGNPLCTWLFVDRSRNGSRVWCEMAVCGNRMRVGRHRRRLDGISRPGTPS